MTGIGLYAAGMASGIAAYVVGRTVLRLRDVHRSALLAERSDNVVRLLDPYKVVGADATARIADAEQEHRPRNGLRAL